jgi:hypothetical protein
LLAPQHQRTTNAHLFVFNQEIKIGKIGHWLLNMEEQQMPIFFEELVLLEDDVYFELA